MSGANARLMAYIDAHPGEGLCAANPFSEQRFECYSVARDCGAAKLPYRKAVFGVFCVARDKTCRRA